MTNLPRNWPRQPIAIASFAMSILAAAVSASNANTIYNTQANYAESKTVTNCGTSNTCAVVFHKVASTKTLLITHVSCRIAAKSTAAPLTRAVLTDNSGQARESLTPMLLSTDGEDVQYFQSNNDASAVFLGSVAPMATPQVSVTFDGSIAIQELSCSVAGHYL
jgi:hypothetical protein